MDDAFMNKAIEMAVENVNAGRGGPFAALVIKNDAIVGEGTNTVTTSNDPTAHAEINAIRAACAALGSYQLEGCRIYSTCEPCPMCMGAIYWARPEKVIFAASRADAKAAGFDDDHIYRELGLAPEKRSVEMLRSAHADAQRPFDAWRAFEQRVEY